MSEDSYVVIVGVVFYTIIFALPILLAVFFTIMYIKDGVVLKRLEQQLHEAQPHLFSQQPQPPAQTWYPPPTWPPQPTQQQATPQQYPPPTGQPQPAPQPQPQPAPPPTSRPAAPRQPQLDMIFMSGSAAIAIICGLWIYIQGPRIANLVVLFAALVFGAYELFTVLMSAKRQ
jgi:hypothetical protein